LGGQKVSCSPRIGGNSRRTQKNDVHKLASGSRKKVPELIAASLENIASYYDADESDMYGSEEKFKTQLRRAFRLFDANHNNKLEKDELAAMLRSMGRRPLKDKIDQIFEILDKNGDGSLDFSEFLNYFKEQFAPLRKEGSAKSKTADVEKEVEERKRKHEEEEAVEQDLALAAAQSLVGGTKLDQEKFAHSGRLFEQKLREVFRSFDTNGNNVITKVELEQALRKLGKAPNKKKVDAIFDTLDIDGNGQIDFDEFAKYFREEHTEAEADEPSSKRPRS